jgi:hypothetical protein
MKLPGVVLNKTLLFFMITIDSIFRDDPEEVTECLLESIPWKLN